MKKINVFYGTILFAVHLLVLAEDESVVNKTNQATPEQSNASAQELKINQGFKPATEIKRLPPKYPKRKQQNSQSGLVDVEFMVGEDGRVFEPVVIQSTDPVFEKEAVKAVLKYEYKPAMLNETPVASRRDIRILFMMEYEKNDASPEFARLIKKTHKILNSDNPDQEKIRENIVRLTTHRYAGYSGLYSLSHLFFLESAFANKFLGLDKQLEALQKLLLFEGRVGTIGKILSEEQNKLVHTNIFRLLIHTGKYSEAHSMYKEIKRNFPEEAKKFDGTMSKVKKLLSSGEPYTRNIKISERGNDWIGLTSRKFYITEVNGAIEKLKFRCERKFEAVTFSLDSEYKIPKSWGSCYLEVIGEIGTTAEIIQF